ncbi:MAG TPA: fatty acid desaturase [Gammaproteobacteria bacterium]|nr:fatty acid desaturase [Gammaproteobacteria bacterium]
MIFGLLDLPWWGYIVVTLALCHVTVMAVTLYLHRDQTHRGLDLHPLVRHFFRFWLWLTTGIVTKEWVAIHRKHHAKCETAEDPHSPQILGLRKVLFQGAELYRAEAKNPETLDKYGRGTPDDWFERRLYTPHSLLGVAIMLVVDAVLFGAPGITIWAIQMMTIPFLAAGVINGVGHYWGYRNFECKDAATNVMPWGVIMGGEELHNNHHAFPSSAKFALYRWEFDIGWVYIRALERLGLATVRRVAPVPSIGRERPHMDLEAVRAVLVNRFHVLRDYTRSVLLPAWRAEARTAGDRLLARARRLLVRDESLLDAAERARLGAVLARSDRLRTLYEFRRRLQALWESSTASNEELVARFREWCRHAELSGYETLGAFARRLKGYSLAPAPL